MAIITTICARGGSKGLPGKNIKRLLGKPLIQYTIEQALSCERLNDVYVSTDDEDIAAIAEKAGAIVPYIRPKELATDSAAKIPVIIHLIEWLERRGVNVETIVDLDPTSPLRDNTDILQCIELLTPDVDVVISGYEAEKNPYFNMVEEDSRQNVFLSKQLGHEFYSRQSSPKVFAMNGSVYVWHRGSISLGLWGGKAKLHKMPRERSIDIDTEVDFELVKLFMSRRCSKSQ